MDIKFPDKKIEIPQGKFIHQLILVNTTESDKKNKPRDDRPPSREFKPRDNRPPSREYKPEMEHHHVNLNQEMIDHHHVNLNHVMKQKT